MKIRKLEHSGLIIENNGHSIVFDPVEIEYSLPELNNVSAIVITHGHGDHLQIQDVEEVITNNPAAKIYCPEDCLAKFESSNLNAEVVRAGQVMQIDDFKLEFFGGEHARIIPDQALCQNLGCIVNDTVANPGDSLDMPPFQPKVLCVALAAPWLKSAEAVAYINAVKPELVIPIHDAVLSNFGKTICRNVLNNSAANVRVLEVDEEYNF